VKERAEEGRQELCEPDMKLQHEDGNQVLQMMHIRWDAAEQTPAGGMMSYSDV
jgi:hypothetical protein